LKKILSILLSLALVVSLGALTAAPAAAVTVTLPTISPTSATYNLDAPAQVTTTITWNSATKINSIVDTEGGNLGADGAGNWTLVGTDLLVIETSYLGGVLT